MKALEKIISNAARYFETLLIQEENNSFLSQVDCRIKFPVFITLIVLSVASEKIIQLLIISIALIVLFGLSNVGVKNYLKRIYLIVIFSIVINIPQIFLTSLDYFLVFVARVYLSLSFLVIFSASTKISDLLSALKFYRVPEIFIITIHSTYVYCRLLFRELNRIILARESRLVGLNKGYREYILERARSILGSFFLRVYEKGETINLAMKSRGFCGKFITVKSPQSKLNILIFIFSSLSVMTLWVTVSYMLNM